jgi:hypothetical protein
MMAMVMIGLIILVARRDTQKFSFAPPQPLGVVAMLIVTMIIS